MLGILLANIFHKNLVVVGLFAKRKIQNFTRDMSLVSLVGGWGVMFFLIHLKYQRFMLTALSQGIWSLFWKRLDLNCLAKVWSHRFLLIINVGV